MNQMLKENKNKQDPSQTWDVAQLIEYLVSIPKPWVWSTTPYKLGVVIHASNPRACQMEAKDQEFRLILNHIESSRPTTWTPVSYKQQQKRKDRKRHQFWWISHSGVYPSFWPLQWPIFPWTKITPNHRPFRSLWCYQEWACWGRSIKLTLQLSSRTQVTCHPHHPQSKPSR